MSELTEERLELLYREEGLTQNEIAEKFEVTQSWISKKMREWDIESRFNGWWSEEEEGILRENYKQVSKDQLIELLPGRDWSMIKQKALDMGLATPAKEHRKSQEVLRCLRRNARENEIDLDMGSKLELSYVLGVVDGDGFHDSRGTIGLEVKSEKFAGKFAEALKCIGLNPGRGERRGKETVWASSRKLVEWLKELDYESRFEWLKETGDRWKYVEGAYDSDGNFSNPGPRICSYDKDEKRFLKRLLDSLGLDAAVHSNNVYVYASSRDSFFKNVNPVYDKRSPQNS